uniref:Uncharacterized protein n=1 Tax=Strigamia maritima TaxID=126957 RepID=T1IIC9_STRMM
MIAGCARIIPSTLTTIPIVCFSPPLVSSTHSSTTKFMKGSNPRRIPDTCLPPFSFTEIEIKHTSFIHIPVNKKKKSLNLKTTRHERKPTLTKRSENEYGTLTNAATSVISRLYLGLAASVTTCLFGFSIKKAMINPTPNLRYICTALVGNRIEIFRHSFEL